MSSLYPTPSNRDHLSKAFPLTASFDNVNGQVRGSSAKPTPQSKQSDLTARAGRDG